VPPIDKEALRRQIRDDLITLKALEGQAVRWNRARRAERQFWTGLLLDIAEVAMPYTLAGRITLRFIRRVHSRMSK